MVKETQETSGAIEQGFPNCGLGLVVSTIIDTAMHHNAGQDNSIIDSANAIIDAAYFFRFELLPWSFPEQINVTLS